MQKLAEICIKRPVFATMLIMSLLVLGFYSYYHLGVDLFPKVDLPIVTVTTTLEGASPEEIESQVTKKIEESVNTISGIDDLSSISSEGISQVVIQFNLEKNIEVASQDVRDKVNMILGDLPDNTDAPIIQKLDPDSSPILVLSVSANRDPRDITYLADKYIKQQIESLNGVGSVSLAGDRTREIHVWLDAAKLEQYGLTISQVKQVLAAQNVEIPGGRIDRGMQEWQLRTLGRVEKAEYFNNIILANVNGLPIKVKDIGRVEDSIEEPRTLARLDGKDSVILLVRKQSGTNTLEVVDKVKEKVEDIKKAIPSDYNITVNWDQSKYIEGSFDAIKEHLIIGAILAALVVLLFIRNTRTMIISAISIPTSIIATFTLMWLMGFTLNTMTMLSLVICVGIVIDDAIVILENIFRFIEEKNMNPMQASLEATKDIGLAVTATTLSLVIIFLPMAFMSGIVGRFMRSFGLTCAFAIMVSLLVAFSLTPMLSSRFIKHNKKGDSAKNSLFYRFFDSSYTTFLKWSLAHRLVVSIICILVILSCIPMLKYIGKDFMVQDDQSMFQVTVKAPEEYSLSRMTQLTDEMHEKLAKLPGVKHVLVISGSGSTQKVNQGSILVELVDRKDRKYKQSEVMAMAREQMKEYKNIRIAVAEPSTMGGGSSNSDFQYYVKGPDIDKLTSISDELKKYLATLPGIVDIDSSLEEGKPELRVHIDREKASDLGVNVSDIANSLNTLVGGQKVTTYKEQDDRYNVRLRVELPNRNNAEAIKRLYVPSTKVGMVRLDQVASVDVGTSPSQINRLNRQRSVTLNANISGEGQSLGVVIDKVNEHIKGMNLGASYSSGLIGKSKELTRTFSNFIMAFILSFIFMYMILASQFESFLHPITILLSLPLSIPFALISMLLFGETLNIFSLLGLFVLFGIVKKNSILQVDHTNNLRRHEGLPRYEAVVTACRDRLRPILMTTFCLIAGMLPMALGTGPGSAMRRSVAFVVIGGQTLCLLLTLLVTPVAYTLFDDVPSLTIWKKSANGMRRMHARIVELFGGVFGSFLGK
jgi:HAE1 family hydrophobic/amphiphilic exporter-1